MAPELFSAEGMDRASFASDFWSLGCVLFQLLTGEPPFGTSSASSSIEERIKREVRNPRTVYPRNEAFVFFHWVKA